MDRRVFAWTQSTRNATAVSVRNFAGFFGLLLLFGCGGNTAKQTEVPSPAITMTVSPSSATVQAGGGAQNFTANVQNDSQSKGVTWFLSGCLTTACGSLSAVSSASGAAISYTAPSTVPNPASITLTAVSVADTTKSASATITISAVSQPPAITLAVSPAAATVQAGGVQSFTATIQNDSQNKGANWSLSGPGCNGTSCGSLSAASSASGVAIAYTAPSSLPSPPTVTLTATSVSDSTKSASAAINLQPPPITVAVSPATATVQPGSGVSFTATVQNDSQNKGVIWSLSGAGCGGVNCGSLSAASSASGIALAYTAPSSVPSPPTVTLTATSVSDKSKSGSAIVTVTAISGSITVTVTPKRAGVTMLEPQQFTATVQNDPSNGGVSWSVDGTNGGASTTGTISSAGLFTPGTQPGVHTVTATSNSDTSVSASATIAVTDLAGVFTYHNDPARTGQNLQEYALTPATVNSSTFGALFSCSVDGYVYAAPLYIANLSVNGQTHNVVFIATEHDSVYAFDADSSSCAPLWQVNFLSSGVTTVPPADTGETEDLIPEIGITSTPVIDPSTNTLYVEAKTKETVGSGCSAGSPCYVHRLHALDLATGAEKFGGPVVITAPDFVSLYHLQRPALLLNNGTVYLGFGSHGDNNAWQGWLMAYNATTLAQQWVWHSTDPTSGNNMGGIWGAGNGPALDAGGNIYVETGNGFFDGTANFSDSVVKLSSAGTLLDYFTPFDQGIMQSNDIDLGSSGPMILPDSVGSSTHPHLMIATGKVGIVYLLDQTNMGKYNPGANQDLGEANVGFNTVSPVNGFYGQPAYWNGNLYTIIVADSLRQYAVSNGNLATVSSSNSSNAFSFRGATPAVSASGATNGIVWVADITAYQSGGAVILDAYDATNVSSLLYSSPSSGTGAAVAAAKFTVPTVANGKVYVGGQQGFTVFGLLQN